MQILRRCLWHREERTPLIPSNSFFSPKKRDYLRIIANIATPVLFGFSGFAAYQWRNDTRVVTASCLSAGALVRIFMEANFPEKWNEIIQSITSKSFFELYEALWNVLLNVSYSTGQAALLNGIAALGGFGLSGDGFFLYKLKPKDRVGHSLAEMNLEKESVNPILGPSFDDIKGQAFLKGALATLGVGLSAFSYLNNFNETGLNVFYRSFGFFLVTQPLGFFGAREWVKRWRASEEKDEPPSVNKTAIAESDGSVSDFEKMGLKTYGPGVTSSDDETSSLHTEEYDNDSSALNQPSDDVEGSSKAPPRMIRTASAPVFSLNNESTFNPPSPLSTHTSYSNQNAIPEDPEYPEADIDTLNQAAGGSPPRESGISFKTKLHRGLAKVITGIGLEAITFLFLNVNQPYTYLAVGGFYGVVQYLAQRKFQVMTKEIYHLQQSKNMTNGKINTALKVERAASAVFLFMVLGWFIYGANESDFQGRLGTIVIMISYVLAEAFALPVEMYFKPEKEGISARLLNHLRYVLYHNPYAIAIACFSLIQITEINDRALQLDSLPKYICGLVALSLFSTSLALNRMRSISTSGFTTTIAPLARMLILRTILNQGFLK